MLLIINNHTPCIKDLKRILEKNNVKAIIKDQRSPLTDVERRKISGVILSGGDPDLDKKINVNSIKADILSLLSFKVPILGICEGHQIIAQMYGGEIHALKKFLDKGNRIEILKKSKIFKGLPDKILMEESHGRYVKKIPDNFLLAATSRKDRIEAMFHKRDPIFSVQFHPEISGSYGEKIIKNFVGICRSN